MSWFLVAWCLHVLVQTPDLVAVQLVAGLVDQVLGLVPGPRSVGRGPRHLVADQVPAGRAPRCPPPGARAADQVPRAGDPGPKKTARSQAARV